MNASIEGLNVVLVARQSSTRDDSLSTEDQLVRMRERCEREGATVAAEYIEKDVSGGRPLAKRPGAKLAVEDIEGKRGTVLMGAYFNRLFRSLKTQAEVIERVEAAGGRVIALDVGDISNGSASQWLSATMIGAMSEHQRLAVAEHTHDSKQRALDEGRPPFPHITMAYQRRADGRLEPHPVNAPLVREAIEMRLAKPAASWNKLAAWLTEAGVVGKDGEPMRVTPTAVETLFASKLLIGELHFGDFRPNLDAIEEPIISRASFRRLQKGVRGRYAKSPALLARLDVLVCGSCGSRMSVDNVARGGKLYAYYRCGFRRPLCSNPATVACEAADEVLRDETIRLGSEVVGSASDVDEVAAAAVAKEAAGVALDEAIETLAGLAGRKATRAVLDELQADYETKSARHERLLASSSSGRTVATLADWDRLSFEGRRGAIQAVVARAVVTPGRGPGRITVEGRGSFLGE